MPARRLPGHSESESRCPTRSPSPPGRRQTAERCVIESEPHRNSGCSVSSPLHLRVPAEALCAISPLAKGGRLYPDAFTPMFDTEIKFNRPAAPFISRRGATAPNSNLKLPVQLTKRSYGQYMLVNTVAEYFRVDPRHNLRRIQGQPVHDSRLTVLGQQRKSLLPSRLEFQLLRNTDTAGGGPTAGRLDAVAATAGRDRGARGLQGRTGPRHPRGLSRDTGGLAPACPAAAMQQRLQASTAAGPASWWPGIP